MIGGRVILALDPGALEPVGAGRAISIVSGTNGKTTTTRLLADAMATQGPVVTNARGANMISGLVSVLAAAAPGLPAVLEVDERFVPRVTPSLRPQTLCLLNLSRDQLDRFGEVRSLSTAWRAAVAASPRTHVVANADDPLVVFAAATARTVTWVGAGLEWTEDAVGCPACDGPIRWVASVWSCSRCDNRRPELDVRIDGDDLVAVVGQGAVARVRLALQLPGRCNIANAAIAVAAAMANGVDMQVAATAMAATSDVAGRYRTVQVGRTSARLLLAKNPAGWLETLSLLMPPPMPLIVAINARAADGRDTSWLWDVPFERLAGRAVVASGERCHDLSTRLHYAGVAHTVERDLPSAITVGQHSAVEVVANYTAFQTLLSSIHRAA